VLGTEVLFKLDSFLAQGPKVSAALILTLHAIQSRKIILSLREI
jgi:hypothetical protein